jgi:hypothetical protein
MNPTRPATGGGASGSGMKLGGSKGPAPGFSLVDTLAGEFEDDDEVVKAWGTDDLMDVNADADDWSKSLIPVQEFGLAILTSSQLHSNPPRSRRLLSLLPNPTMSNRRNLKPQSQPQVSHQLSSSLPNPSPRHRTSPRRVAGTTIRRVRRRRIRVRLTVGEWPRRQMVWLGLEVRVGV